MTTSKSKDNDPSSNKIITIITWIIAFLMIVMMGIVVYQYFSGKSVLDLFKFNQQAPESDNSQASMPNFDADGSFNSVKPDANLDTVLPTGSRREVVNYTIEAGDSLFAIAEEYDLEPESILWANFDVLNDDPHLISPGMTLKIPPVDGILYEWKDGDTLANIAGKYYADMQDILLFPGNDLDLSNPTIDPGKYVMVPDGYRAFQTWVVPVIVRGEAGVNTSFSGPGLCSTTEGGYIGTYSFTWPTPHREVSGNDYWGGHTALDLMCYQGDSIYASDAGVVVYRGPIEGGYGNLIMIDHGTGYQTLYAHLSGFNVGCGQSVTQGQVIGFCGSTGNSTGPHLHFEVRLGGGIINPWQVLR